jgi:hypothetical protein
VAQVAFADNPALLEQFKPPKRRTAPAKNIAVDAGETVILTESLTNDKTAEVVSYPSIRHT